MTLAKVILRNQGRKCPFSNEEIQLNLEEGKCFWIQGDSGAGKTTISHCLLGLESGRDIGVEITWQEEVSKKTPPIGMLFQEGVLVDSLNLEENLILSFKSGAIPYTRERLIEVVQSVGLKEEDLYKMPEELSGGMLRRASLIQVLIQRKKVIILDEPFVGLDHKTAQGIVEDLIRLKKKGICFLLISHQEQYAKQLIDEGCRIYIEAKAGNIKFTKPSCLHLPRYRFSSRVLSYLKDYLGISLPLIILAFCASGFAISLLLAELLHNLNVHKMILEVESSLSAIIRWLVSHKIEELAEKYIPLVNRKVYIISVARSFVIELGPLLTALLLAGRIGGSYAGEVGMMEATNQNRLLRTLGISPRMFSFFPALIAALIAAPILTFVGTVVGLLTGMWIGTMASFDLFTSKALFWEALKEQLFSPTVWYAAPFFINFYRSVVFILIILFTGEVLAKYRKSSIRPRDVPKVITWSVVISCLLIIVADWGLTQMLVG